MNLQKFATKIFKVKIGLSLELMNGIFEFIEKMHSVRVNSQFKPEDPNDKMWHKSKEKYDKESFSKWM